MTEEHKLVLTINRQPIVQWFKEQWEKLQQNLRNSVQREQKTEDSNYKFVQHKAKSRLNDKFYICVESSTQE